MNAKVRICSNRHGSRDFFLLVFSRDSRNETAIRSDGTIEGPDTT